MFMIEFIKEKIAAYIVKTALKRRSLNQQSFSDWFNSSFNFFIIMPSNETDFRNAFSVLEFLDSQNKTLTIFTNDFRVALLPIKFRNKSLGFSINEINKLKLPSKELTIKLKKLCFDVSIDLNREENLFSSFAINLVESKIKIGIEKKKSVEFYNLIFSGNNLEDSIFYENFSNFLKMF